MASIVLRVQRGYGALVRLDARRGVVTVGRVILHLHQVLEVDRSINDGLAHPKNLSSA